MTPTARPALTLRAGLPALSHLAAFSIEKRPLRVPGALTLRGFHDDDGNLFHAEQTALAGQGHFPLLERLTCHVEPLCNISEAD